MTRPLLVVVAVALCLPGVARATGGLELRSPIADAAGLLTVAHACRPELAPLSWSAPPPGTRSFVVMVEDGAAQPSGFVHYVVYNLPASTLALEPMPPGAIVGLNGRGERAFVPLCPQHGLHFYSLQVFALDVMLPSFAAPTRDRLRSAMAGHVLAAGSIVATTLPPNLSASARK